MRRLLLMVRKDLLRRRRAPLGVLLLLSFPLIFSLMLALTFGTGKQELPKVRLLIENRDGGPGGRLILGAFSSQALAGYFEVKEVGEEGTAEMEAGRASALLRVPPRFTRDLIDGRQAILRLVRNPSEGILPEVAEQVAGTLAEGLSAASRVLRAPLDQMAPMIDEDRGVTAETVSKIAVAIYESASRGGKYLFPPAITLETVTLTRKADEKTRADNSPSSIFLYVLPGVSVFALFMLGDLSMRDILTETAGGTLRRQLSGPIGTGTLVAAKAMYTAAIATICLAILSGIGWIAKGTGIDLPGFAVLSMAVVMSVTGFAAAMYGLARSERQGSTLASLLYLVMAFTGGSFIPLESLPASLRQLSPFSIFYWGTSGYRKLLLEEGRLSDILLHAGVLCAAGLVLLAVGTALLDRRVRSGAVA